MAFTPNSAVVGPDQSSILTQAVISIIIKNGVGRCYGAQLLEGDSCLLPCINTLFSSKILFCYEMCSFLTFAFIVFQEEPLSPIFSGLEEAQNDVWQIFTDDVVKQAQSPPQESLGDLGGWLPDSPSDSCDSIDELKAKGQLASQLLEDLDFCIKDGE